MRAASPPSANGQPAFGLYMRQPDGDVPAVPAAGADLDGAGGPPRRRLLRRLAVRHVRPARHAAGRTGASDRSRPLPGRRRRGPAPRGRAAGARHRLHPRQPAAGDGRRARAPVPRARSGTCGTCCATWTTRSTRCSRPPTRARLRPSPAPSTDADDLVDGAADTGMLAARGLDERTGAVGLGRGATAPRPDRRGHGSVGDRRARLGRRAGVRADRPLPDALADELLVHLPVLVRADDRPARFAAPADISSLAPPGARLLAQLGRRPLG